MKVSGLVLLVIVAAAGAAFFYKPASQSANYFRTTNGDTRFYNDTLVSMAEENRSLRKRLVALEKANQELHEQLAFASAGQIKPYSEIQQSSSASPATTLTEATFEELRSTAETAVEVGSYLGEAGTSPDAMQQDLSRKFNGEPVDYSWAINHEQKLGRLFESQEKLWEFVPETITCKTTRCQIKVPVASFDESNRAMQALSQALAKNAEGLDDAMLISAPDPASGFVDFYIGRDQHAKILR